MQFLSLINVISNNSCEFDFTETRTPLAMVSDIATMLLDPFVSILFATVVNGQVRSRLDEMAGMHHISRATFLEVATKEFATRSEATTALRTSFSVK